MIIVIRSTCAWCEGPLTRRQQVRRRSFCSRSCAKTNYHADLQQTARELGQRSWATVGRARYIERLKVALAQCKTLGDAYRRGYVNGYKVGAERRRRGQVPEGRAVA